MGSSDFQEVKTWKSLRMSDAAREVCSAKLAPLGSVSVSVSEVSPSESSRNSGIPELM